MGCRKRVPSECQDKAWQTCSCLGTWHYNRSAYEDNWYKSAETVIHMLIDIVSKNGNLLLSVPMKGNGTIDDKEEKNSGRHSRLDGGERRRNIRHTSLVYLW